MALPMQEVITLDQLRRYYELRRLWGEPGDLLAVHVDGLDCSFEFAEDGYAVMQSIADAIGFECAGEMLIAIALAPAWMHRRL